MGSLSLFQGIFLTQELNQGLLHCRQILYQLSCEGSYKERANQFLKSVIKKITQETSLGWKKALPVALLCTRIAPKE